MTSSNPTAQPPPRHSLAWSLIVAIVVAFLLVIALRAPEQARIFELPRPVPRPRLLDAPAISPTPPGVKSPKH